jgi:hypothetical protein
MRSRRRLTEDTAPKGVIPDAKRIYLTDKLHLLQRDQYADVMDDIGKMHEETLAAE